MQALALAARDPRTPWSARVVALAVTAYAFSPIDLIPDFIPVLGLLDDILIVPAGIWLVVRLIPPELMATYRSEAASAERRVSLAGAAFVLLAWAAFIAAAFWWWTR